MTSIYYLGYLVFNIALHVLFIYSENVRKGEISSFYKELKLRVHNRLPNAAHHFGGHLFLLLLSHIKIDNQSMYFLTPMLPVKEKDNLKNHQENRNRTETKTGLPYSLPQSPL